MSAPIKLLVSTLTSPGSTFGGRNPTNQGVALDWLELEKGWLYRVVADGETKIVLELVGEIRFGPAFFALWIRVGDRPERGKFAGPGRNVVFGEVAKGSSDGRFWVFEKCDRFDTAAVMIDVERGCEATLVHFNGYLRDIAIDPDRVRLHILISDGKGWSEETREVPFPSAWQPIEWWPAAKPNS